MFQHPAARRRLGKFTNHHMMPDGVSTHSRPKAAGSAKLSAKRCPNVSTHSRPKAAGCCAYQ
ncbi:hypothetical protein NEIMUCOT_04705 [Neisseria mucosa ATCC 25996]|uniref:Uncharacterized protein n=1 Tax=Neisseria mucosa (strain ATCC 25996 / DSM 4631 / NCTC 10774 / M26) TaxID=546266 RepID=D2ZVR2_NEIM2|nr:hypothetical protein NEIMUCOT_04705 [Neisseria mucosa ATCC 25996]